MRIKDYFKAAKDQDARERVMDATANFLYFLAALLVAISLTLFIKGLGLHMLSAALLYLVCAYLLKKFRSRTSAVLLNILNIPTALNGIMMALVLHTGVVDAFLLLLATIASIRVLPTTFSYHRVLKTRVIVNHLIAQTLLGFIYTVIFLLTTIITMGYTGLLDKVDNTVNMTLTTLNLILGYGLTFRGTLPFSKNRKICRLATDPVGRVDNDPA